MNLEEKKEGYVALKKVLSNLSKEDLVIWAAINTITITECLGGGHLPTKVAEIFDEDMAQYDVMMVKVFTLALRGTKNERPVN
jgi:hypothetical protein